MNFEDKMSKSGVLILQPSKLKLPQLYNLLHISAKYVGRVLYIDFNLKAQETRFSPAEMYKIFQEVYKVRTRETTNIDVRVLLDSKVTTAGGKRMLSHPLDVALIHSTFQNTPGILDAVYSRYIFRNQSSTTLQFLDGTEEPCSCKERSGMIDRKLSEEIKTYPSVAVGGTFDRLHNGHRLLLSTCCLLSDSRIVVGVSDESLLARKVLGELVEPLDVRMKNVEDFIDDVKPGLIKEIVPINDPAGPTRTDTDLQCLVLSSETLNGGHAVNKIRKEAGLSQMHLFAIDLVKEEVDKNGSATRDDSKMSSTAGRKRDLGKLLRPATVRRPRPHPSNVYVIGLTGGIASGKSSVARRLEKLGAHIIDADKLGHSVYEKGTDAYEEIVKTFGPDILNSNKSINRRRLGCIVFNDESKMRVLNSIVWPQIMSKIEGIIQELGKGERSVCVVEAAVLLEAGWDHVMDEVWVLVIPPQEAVRRLQERNGLTEEEAEKRLASQMKNKDRVGRANVVLSTLWAPEYTQQQVERAWSGLLERINQEAITPRL